jgi:cell division protease FtsH
MSKVEQEGQNFKIPEWMTGFTDEVICRIISVRDSILSRWYELRPSTRLRLKLAAVLVQSLGISLLLRKILQRRSKSPQTVPLVVSASLSMLMEMIQDGQVSRVSFFPDGKLLGENPLSNQLIESHRVPGSDSAFFDLVQKNCAEYRYVSPPPNLVGAAAQVIVPLAFMGVWYKLLQQFMKSASGADQEGISGIDRKQRIPKVSFDHVISPSKVELQEIVQYLNNPKQFSQHGAKLPRGVLLVGASGTGKTLMARAVAGEAHCAFLSVSASEFVETYVGRGSARIRQLFKQAREYAPCVLFIDEIDALGKRQASFGGGTAHDEYVQTMNQLLVELDGIGGHQDGIVVVAATNRYDALDSALLRPGRFDRHVLLELPTESERFEILDLNCKLHKMNLAPDLDLKIIAQNSLSFSGADLANVVNESVFFSLRRGSKIIGVQDFRKALEKCHHVVMNRTTKPSQRKFHENINTALE